MIYHKNMKGGAVTFGFRTGAACRLAVLAALFCLAVLLSGCGRKHISAPSLGSGTVQDASLGARVAQTARSQVGVHYRLGGTTPRGFDCSGLIWWAYRQNGLKVPRVTVDQARAGYAVPKSAPRPGDIMVFRTSSGPRGLHTGIYAGNNTFIHSPSRGKTVRRENMEPYWGNRLIAVRRIVI